MLSPRSLVTCGMGFVLLVASVVPGQAELRYTPKTGATYAYSVEIKAELPDATETMKGVITFTVKEATEDRLKLDYQGGLNRTRKTKATARGPRGFRGPFGPPRGFGGPPSFFGTPTFKGLTQTTNKLTLTSRGDVVGMEGSSQLPYLLGNLSHLIFEPLPEKPQESWDVKNGIWISETNERQSFPRFGPPRPGQSNTNSTKRSAGAEGTEFKIKKSEDKTLTIDKTYVLKSTEIDGKSFEVEGRGTWVFDEAKGISRKLEFEQTVTVTDKYVSIKIPMTCKYEMLSKKQLAAYKEEQKKKQEEMKARLAEAREKAEIRRMKPLTAEQKAEVLKRLASDKFGEVLRGLNTLRFKDPQEPDAEIAVALKKLSDHKNFAVRMNAEQVAKKWAAPEDKK